MNVPHISKWFVVEAAESTGGLNILTVEQQMFRNMKAFEEGRAVGWVPLGMFPGLELAQEMRAQFRRKRAAAEGASAGEERAAG